MADRKTARELGVSQREYDALVKVRNGLASGCFVHVEYYDELDETEPSRFEDKRIFNMDTSASTSSCGTVACIGGWMKTIMSPKATNDEINDYVCDADTRTLGPLFFPPSNVDMHTVTTEQAVLAIDNFLTTGRPDWEKATT